MTVCPNCGNEAQDTAVFCDQCGTRLIEQEEASVPPVKTEPEIEPVAPVSAPEPPHEEALLCGTCGQSNVPGALFCENCGATLDPLEPETAEEYVAAAAETPPTAEENCPVCGATVGAGDEFCDNCGASLTAAATTEAEAETPAGPTDVAAQPGPTVAGPRLVVADSGAEIPLPAEAEILVGREDPVSGIFPDVDLTSHGGEEGGVSRKHVKLEVQNGGTYTLQDLDSTNFTFVNKERLAPFSPKSIQNGDELRLGRVRLIFKTQ